MLMEPAETITSFVALKVKTGAGNFKFRSVIRMMAKDRHTCTRLRNLDAREDWHLSFGVLTACDKLCDDRIDQHIEVTPIQHWSDIRRGSTGSNAVTERALGPSYIET